MRNFVLWACSPAVVLPGLIVIQGARAGAAADPNDWPWWRGPNRNGSATVGATVAAAPTEWSESKNIRWATALPGSGHSDPAVHGDRIFVTAADETRQVQYILGYDFETGKELWRTPAHRSGFTKKHDKNTHASASPACDGELVFAVFVNDGALWVTATDRDGDQRWQKRVGDFVSFFGYASSPTLYKDTVIVSGDHAQGGYLAALKRKTGETIWNVPRSMFEEGSYSSPIVVEVADRPQVLLSGTGTVAGYDPQTGKQLWWCDGPAKLMANTMAYGNELVYASGGYPEKEVLCIKASGSGNITKSHVVWRSGRGVAYCSSPLLSENRLYCVTAKGVATCYDAATGQVHWRERLGGEVSASPVLARDKVYLGNEFGTTFVFKDSSQFELIAENKLPDTGFASPVICRGRILLRGQKKLYCVAAK
jgi:outer membrane protein assembly factor BamB